MNARVRVNPLTRWVHTRCRSERFVLWERSFPPRAGERLLEVGVSPLEAPGENHLLEVYPYPRQITAVSIHELDALRKRHPEVCFVSADARDLPFADRAFDLVHCNAVIEHVGPQADQRRMVGELVRVARAGMISTPARSFPVDSHTNLPMLHWLPRGAHVAALRWLGRAPRDAQWPTWLLGARTLQQLVPPGVTWRIHRQRLAGMTAVISLLFRHPS